MTTNNTSKKQKLFKRNFSKFNRENFLLELLEIDWANVIALDKYDPNYSFDRFIKAINELLDKHIPLKKNVKKAV